MLRARRGPRARRGRRSATASKPSPGIISSQPPVHSQNGCQASATRVSRPARPQSSARLTTRSGAKKKAGRRARAARPPPAPNSSQWVTPTAMLWTSSSPKCEWTARRTVAVARDVDVGGRPALERVDRVVGDGAAVDPQALDELGAARRGEADQLHPLALGEQEGGGDRGLAGGARDHDRPARRQALVGELVVDQERGEEERPQQHLDRPRCRPGRRGRRRVAR